MESLLVKTLLDVITGYQRTQVLTAAVFLDVFTKLETGEELTMNERAKALLDALVSMGLVRFQDGRYKNTLVSEIFLSRLSDWNICDFVLHHGVNLYPIWDHLRGAVKEDAPVLAATHDLDLMYYISGLHSVAPKKFPFIHSIKEPKRILDVGAGSLWAGCLFRQYFPEAEIVAVDRKDVCRWITGRATVRKIRLQPVEDYVTADLEEKFDLVFVSEVIHSKCEREACRFLEKCYSDLTEEGIVIVREYLKESSYRVMFNLNLLLCTKNGKAYGFREVEELMEEAGFQDIERVDDEEDILGRGYVIGHKRR